MKKCPFCAEEIQDEAIKCRYCNELLNVAKPTDPPSSSASEPKQTTQSETKTMKAPKSGMDSVVKYVIGGGIAVCVILVCFGLLYLVYLALPVIFALFIICWFLAYAQRRGAARDERRAEKAAKKQAAEAK